jgi:hypothetical protein
MAGTVMRLPGTGEGVARLVAVSRVKVDMGPSVATARRVDQPDRSTPRAERTDDNRNH